MPMLMYDMEDAAEEAEAEAAPEDVVMGEEKDVAPPPPPHAEAMEEDGDEYLLLQVPQPGSSIEPLLLSWPRCGPVAGGAAPADQSVAGDVQILISEIGLDPKVLAQYGSLLGQLTHRQQKLRVIAQGDQVRAGAATVYCVHTDP
jgi:hypothetical protein